MLTGETIFISKKEYQHLGKSPIFSIYNQIWGDACVQITLIEEGRTVFYFSENLKTERTKEGNCYVKRRQSACSAADHNQY